MANGAQPAVLREKFIALASRYGHIRSNSPPIPEAALKTAKANVKDGSGEVFRYGP
jgi:hypothetical protein